MAQLSHLLAQRAAPTGPGEILRTDALPAHGLTQTDAARAMQIPLNRLHEICRGRRAVTADTAVRLAALLGTTPEYWLNLQANVDLWRAAHALKKSRRRAA